METTTCSRCGTAAQGPPGGAPLGWSTASTADGRTALCEACTRDHARDIEARLDEAWWT